MKAIEHSQTVINLERLEDQLIYCLKRAKGKTTITTVDLEVISQAIYALKAHERKEHIK